MKLVVTGGAGFIGSNFIRYILAQHPEDSILNLDKLTYSGNLQTLRDVEKNERYTFVRGDIGDRRKVQEVLSQRVRSDRPFRGGNARRPQHSGRFGLRQDQRPGNAVPLGCRPAGGNQALRLGQHR